MIRTEDKDSNLKIGKFQLFIKSQFDPTSSFYAKISVLADSCLRENKTYTEFKKKLFTLEHGVEQKLLELIHKFEATWIGASSSVGEFGDYILQSKNTVNSESPRSIEKGPNQYS